MNILDLMDDPRLFEKHFPGGTWDAWRAALAALFALPMDEAMATTYRTCTGRTNLPTKPFNEAALVIGRRGGKSRALALIAVWLAAFKDWTPFLSVGEIAYIMLIGADTRQAKLLLRYVRELIHDLPMLSALVTNENQHSVVLSTRCTIEVSACNMTSTRGFTAAAVLADEAAFWAVDPDAADSDVEVLRALRPALATLPGSVLIMASSPFGRQGALWESYRQNYGRDESPVLAWRAPSLLMNPSLDSAVVEAAFKADPIAAAAEFGAEFRNDVSGFLSHETIMSCVETGRQSRPPHANQRYHAFCDPSGGANDSFTCAVTHADGAVCVLDALYERRAPFNPSQVVSEVSALLRQYRVGYVQGDHYSAMWVVEAFRNCGVEYRHSPRDRSAIYIEASALFMSGRVLLLDDARLIHELCNLERKVTSGRDRVDHPAHGRDDLANATCGALVLASQPVKKMSFAPPVVIMASDFANPRTGTSLTQIDGSPHSPPWNDGGNWR